MAVTGTIYGLFLESLVEARVNVRTDPMYCMLTTSAYSFNQHSQKYKSVITGEVVGTGYVAGGKIVTGLTPAYDSATKTLKLPAGNMLWPTVTWVAVTGAVLYMKPTGLADSACPLVGYLNFGGAITKTAENFYINWAAVGPVKLTMP